MTNQGTHGSPLLHAARGPQDAAQHLRMHIHDQGRRHLHDRADLDDDHRSLRQYRRHLHHHNQQHIRSHADVRATSPSSSQQRRQASEAGPDVDPVNSVITQVIQTVSIIQYVDALGTPLATSTEYLPPLSRTAVPTTGTTLDSFDTALPSTIASYSNFRGNSSSTTASLTATDTPLPFSTAVLLQPPPSVTSAPSTVFPTLSGASNTTSSDGVVPNRTRGSLFYNSSTPSATPLSSSSLSETTLTSSFSPSSFSSSFSSSSFSSSSFSSSTTSSSSISSTTAAIAGGLPSNASPAAPAPTPESSPAATAPFTIARTDAIVGGVVGAICGVALLAFAVFFIFRWRRRFTEGSHRDLGGGDGNGNTSASRGMSEHSAPYAVPAALAALSGVIGGGSRKRQEAPATSEEQPPERGFVRVSGRKLPSVLRHGGDGYTHPFADPRDSMVSGGDRSVMYRDSDVFFAPPAVSSANTPASPGSRLKLGSPMRPESGIPVIHPGPARTPVQEVAPLFPTPPGSSGVNDSSLRPPLQTTRRNMQDPIGRSLASQDGSRGSRISQSRFSENVS